MLLTSNSEPIIPEVEINIFPGVWFPIFGKSVWICSFSFLFFDEEWSAAAVANLLQG